MARLDRAVMTERVPALPAAKHPLGAALVYHGLLRGAVALGFHRVYLRCEGAAPAPHNGPMIFYLNHPSWWDGHMCALLDRVAFKGAFDSYIMMEEAQLQRYGFFRWIGAFSVDRHSPREAARSVAYIAGLLRENPRRCCYIFPQGTITPADRRPVVAYNGVAHIVRRVGAATLCPVALRYELRGEQRPDAFIRLGPCARVDGPVDVPALTGRLAEELAAACDALRDDVVSARLEGYQVLARGRPGVDRAFDQVRALLAR